MKPLEPFSQRWKQQKSIQSSIVSESKTPYQPSQTAFPPEIQQIYKKLSHQYFNISLQDVFRGREITTSEGLCYCIDNEIPFSEPAREIEITKKKTTIFSSTHSRNWSSNRTPPSPPEGFHILSDPR